MNWIFLAFLLAVGIFMDSRLYRELLCIITLVALWWEQTQMKKQLASLEQQVRPVEKPAEKEKPIDELCRDFRINLERAQASRRR